MCHTACTAMRALPSDDSAVAASCLPPSWPTVQVPLPRKPCYCVPRLPCSARPCSSTLQAQGCREGDFKAAAVSRPPQAWAACLPLPPVRSRLLHAASPVAHRLETRMAAPRPAMHNQESVTAVVGRLSYGACPASATAGALTPLECGWIWSCMESLKGACTWPWRLQPDRPSPPSRTPGLCANPHTWDRQAPDARPYGPIGVNIMRRWRLRDPVSWQLPAARLPQRHSPSAELPAAPDHLASIVWGLTARICTTCSPAAHWIHVRLPLPALPTGAHIPRHTVEARSTTLPPTVAVFLSSCEPGVQLIGCR